MCEKFHFGRIIEILQDKDHLLGLGKFSSNAHLSEALGFVIDLCIPRALVSPSFAAGINTLFISNRSGSSPTSSQSVNTSVLATTRNPIRDSVSHQPPLEEVIEAPSLPAQVTLKWINTSVNERIISHLEIEPKK